MKCCNDFTTTFTTPPAIMYEYRVQLVGEHSCNVTGTDADVSDGGILTIYQEGTMVAAFQVDQWRRMEAKCLLPTKIRTSDDYCDE